MLWQFVECNGKSSTLAPYFQRPSRASPAICLYKHLLTCHGSANTCKPSISLLDLLPHALTHLLLYSLGTWNCVPEWPNPSQPLALTAMALGELLYPHGGDWRCKCAREAQEKRSGRKRRKPQFQTAAARCCKKCLTGPSRRELYLQPILRLLLQTPGYQKACSYLVDSHVFGTRDPGLKKRGVPPAISHHNQAKHSRISASMLAAVARTFS